MRLTISGEYPANWREISDATMRAAGHRCVRCRHPFDPDTRRPLPCDERCDPERGRFGPWPLKTDAPQHWVGPGLNYGVHHFDGDKGNCRWWNLMALCNSCHLSVQARVVPERPWLFAHSEWALPYVGGFYAFWFADREEPRERVLALPRFFLAVGQPWLYPDLADAVRRYITGEDEMQSGHPFVAGPVVDDERAITEAEWRALYENRPVDKRPNGP